MTEYVDSEPLETFINEPEVVDLDQMQLRIERHREFYLKRNPAKPIMIAPLVVVEDYYLELAYDLRDGPVTVIPKGSKVVGEWENYGDRIRFKAKKVILGDYEYQFVGISEASTKKVGYNRREVENAPFFHQTGNFLTGSNAYRRTIDLNYRGKILGDRRVNSFYHTYDTHQIKCKLLMDFVF